jgi:transcriptional regulator with XRE-family HTH domain
MQSSANAIDKHVGARVRMRRLMLRMSQTTLGESLGITFQQVQKYEKGANRISASRLQQIAHILQVPVSFFFEGAPVAVEQPRGDSAKTPSLDYTMEFAASTDGLTLSQAFMSIKNARLRRSIVNLVERLGSSR